ncbi:MAG: hypothetical protein M3186_12615 [Actinomycetota bacterium]|nr:hypothetical protein [Actinomycetota bacterium]
MHHLAQAHTAHQPPIAVANATNTGHADSHPALNPVEARSIPASVLASPADCCDPMSMIGHFCLAVLTGITALAAALIFAAGWRRLLEPGHLPAAASAAAARAPPIGCARLTQLCVLRR